MDPSDLGGLGKPADRVLGWLERAAQWAVRFCSSYRAAKSSRSVVSQPIANPDLFEGREHELAELGDRFSSRNVIWITGGPGIGKSALVGRFLHRKGLDSKARSFELTEGTTLQYLLESINSFLYIAS